MASLGLLGAIGGVGKGLSEMGAFEMKRQAEEETQLKRDAATEQRARDAARAKLLEADTMAQVKSQRDAGLLDQAEASAAETLGPDVDRGSPEYLREVWNVTRRLGGSPEAVSAARSSYESAQRASTDFQRLKLQEDGAERRHVEAMAAGDRAEKAAARRAENDRLTQERQGREAQLRATQSDLDKLDRNIAELDKERAKLSGKPLVTPDMEKRLGEIDRELGLLKGAREAKLKERTDLLSRPVTRTVKPSGGGRTASASRANFVDQLPTSGVTIGRRARNTVTGEILVFDGSAWVPAKQGS